VTKAHCQHQAVDIGAKHPNDLLQLRLFNTLLANLKTNCGGTSHAFTVDKVARRHLGGCRFRFKPRFSMADMTAPITNVLCCRLPFAERGLRVAEVYG